MPSQIHPVPGTPFVLSRLYDAVDLPDCLELLQEMTVNPGNLQGVFVICDVRDGQVRLTYDELQSVVSFVRTHEPVFSGVRWGMVVSGLLEYGLARSAGLMVGDIPQDYRVFRSIDAACQWAGLPVREWVVHQQCRRLEPA